MFTNTTTTMKDLTRYNVYAALDVEARCVAVKNLNELNNNIFW